MTLSRADVEAPNAAPLRFFRKAGGGSAGIGTAKPGRLKSWPENAREVAIPALTLGKAVSTMVLPDPSDARLNALEKSLDLQRNALARTARRLTRLVAHAGELSMQVRMDASVERILYLSPELPPLLEEESLFSYIAEASHLALRQWLQLAQATPDAPVRLMVETNSSPTRWLELQGSVLPDTVHGTVLVTARNITAWKENEQKLSSLAVHDPLTGLPNRTQLQTRIREAIARFKRSGEGFALLMLDLDGFKRVNDSLGHPAGDALLQIAAARLRENLREVDTVARTGGDEFVCLLPGAATAEATHIVAQRLLSVLRQPFTIEGQSLHLSASVGVTLCPEHSTDEVALAKFADTAMYQAKAQGKNRSLVYTQDLSPAAEQSLRLESAMHEAVQRGEFSLHYQPIVHPDGRLAGCEALMRWFPANGPAVSPVDFIPLAENNGLISVLGSWALKTACMQLMQWQDQLPASFYVSVNVSPRQFRNHNFVQTVRSALELSGLPAERLALEITEGVLMENPEYARRTLEALSDMGITTCVDDFGTGYSSLAYLKNFALNVLKVDRSFVKDLPAAEKDLSIASAIISLARELNLKVVAEGVETPDQHKVLADRGCELYQGWLFGKPVDAVAFIAAHGFSREG